MAAPAHERHSEAPIITFGAWLGFISLERHACCESKRQPDLIEAAGDSVPRTDLRELMS